MIESLRHVSLATAKLCIDELRYSLWAANCIYPGLSTMIVNLLHTTDSVKRNSKVSGLCTLLGTSLSCAYNPTYHQDYVALYDTSSGNELYYMRLGDSRLFREYAGLSFTHAAQLSYEKQVCLIAIKNNISNKIEVNPGSAYILVISPYFSTEKLELPIYTARR